MFSSYDLNSDGFLSAEELQHLLKAVAPHLPDTQLAQLVSKVLSTVTAPKPNQPKGTIDLTDFVIAVKSKTLGVDILESFPKS